jgi:hypothetical protein
MTIHYIVRTMLRNPRKQTRAIGRLPAVLAFAFASLGTLDLASASSPAAPKRVCTPPGWCWEQPLPQGEDLHAIWGRDEHDVWAVGTGGILHWDGITWSGAWQTTAELHAIRGTARDVWTIGRDGTVLHSADGSSWAALPQLSPPRGTDVSGTAATDVWASDGTNQVHHWDGTRWTGMAVHARESARVQTILALGTDDVWAAGAMEGAIVTWHWDGRVWTAMATNARASFDGLHLWGGSQSNLWLDTGDTLLRWTGKAWAEVAGKSGASVAVGEHIVVAGPQATLTWTANRRTSKRGSGLCLAAIWGTKPDALWGVAPTGRILRWNGSRWSDWQADTVRDDIVALAGPRHALWAVGESGSSGPGILRRKENQWGATSSPWALLPKLDRVNTTIRAFSAVANNDAWLAGGREAAVISTQATADIRVAPVCLIAHWNGRRWARVRCPGGEPIRALWALATDDVWASSAEGLFHWNGRTWSSANLPNAERLLALGGSSASEGWAAMLDPSDCGPTFLHHREGWTAVARPAGIASDCSQHVLRIQAIWANAVDDVWAVGSRGLVLRWNGIAWQVVASGTTEELTAVTGTNPSDVWVAGAHGAVLHWDGTAFAPQADVPRHPWRAIWVDETEVVVAGAAGRILRWSRP